jgi:hypothetical protein
VYTASPYTFHLHATRRSGLTLSAQPQGLASSSAQVALGGLGLAIFRVRRFILTYSSQRKVAPCLF